MPFYQNLMTKQMKNLNNSMQESVLDTIQVLDYSYQIPFEVDRQNTFGTELKSDTSTITLKSNKRSMSFFKKSKYGWKSNTSVLNLPIQYSSTTDAGIFGTKETAVYMTLSDDFCRHRTSSTQATASINKCFQVSNEWMPFSPSTNATSTDYCSSCTIPYHWQKHVIPDELLNTNIYFFGRKKDERKQKGMGQKSQSHTKLQKTSQTSTHALRSKGSDSSTSINKSKDAKFKLIPAKTSKGAATAASTKTVTIKDEKQLKPCPALGGTTKGDMMVTVSHIKIGPKETCPTHGNEPCQGPKCVLASSGEEQGPVKVTTVNNPRRGVFEIVIRKLTGAPLARNELMLEWTPPPSRTPTCSGLCPVPCFPPSPYRPPKCKLIVCRPLSCKPKCCKKKSCGRIPCRTLPCKPRRKYCKTSCCANPCSSCNPCKPCPPPSCGPASCSPPCGRPACTSPCKSSPCLKPCLVGRKRYRKSRSQPKIKSHRKKISPCCNRSRICPVVRCRSVPGPRIKGAPFCLPRKCCSVGLCQPTKSACSSCCG